MGKIYERNILYDILRPYVDWCTRHSYRKVEICGKENIPQDGAILLAPNHCNTLMDALVVLRSHKGESVFGARADMFNKPMLAKIMYFLRILPMVRQRDGLRNVLKNYETTETIVETLAHNVRFCMYPEGRHRTMHSLLPLGKGIFRAAFAANTLFGAEKPVYIVPVGIEYGDYFRFRTTSLLTFGKPINVTEFVKQLDVENEAYMMEPLRHELQERMSELITYIKDDSDYEAKWALTKMLALDFKGSLAARKDNNRRIVEEIESLCKKEPEKMSLHFKEVIRFEQERRKKRVSIFSFRKGNTATKRLLKSLAAIIGLPYFIFSATVSLPLWITFELLKAKMIKDKAFRNTAGFGVKLALGSIMGLIYTISAFSLLPAWVAAGLIILSVPTYSYFYDYCEFMRILISDFRLSGNRQMRETFSKITNL